MNYYKFAKENIKTNSLIRQIKDVIRTNSFCKYLFNLYNIPLEKIDNNLTIEIIKLRGKNAKSSGETIYLNKELFEDNKSFEDKVHFIIHELVHWLTRQREQELYFADKEEYESFSLAMAYELNRGKTEKDLYITFFPIIIKHFNNENNAKKFFKALYSKALEKIKGFKNELV